MNINSKNQSKLQVLKQVISLENSLKEVENVINLTKKDTINLSKEYRSLGEYICK